MSGGMYLAAAGALVQQMRLGILANNVANIDTIGYKGEKTVFQVSEATPSPAPTAPPADLQPLSPFAPPFSTVAKAAVITPERLRSWLLNPHPAMPQLDLTLQEIEDLVAYLQELGQQ